MGCPIDLVNKQMVDYKRVNILPSTGYQTYGIFCSFNCAKSFAQFRSFDPMFRESVNLLAKMYVETYGRNDDGSHNEPVNIIPAPPIELMASYGGAMTDAQYKSLIGFKSYTVNHVVKMFPVTISVTEEEENE